jgi:cobalt/nickel transport system ATP-binding protein
MIDRKRQKRAVMIRLENVCFAYEKEIALRYVDLHINRGDSIVIQGPNGCGKSTLIKLLNGIIFPSEGKYFYQGNEINEKALKNSQFAKWFHQQMGYVFQNADTQLFCGSVEEEIAFGPVQMGLSEAEIKKRTEDCLHLFGLEKLRDRPPYHLSGGEKRKVSLACILSLNPEVLILDEPLAGLDEKTQDMLVDFLQSFHKAGKTLITITHNRQLAETIGTRFACMNEEHELKMLS